MARDPLGLAEPLERIRPADGNRVGGKAAGLARLRGESCPVPATWGLTTAAHEMFLAESGLGRRHDEHVASFLEDQDDGRLEARARDLAAAIREAPLPAALGAALDRIAAGLADPLAVRSSATAEDGRTHAMAGVFRSRIGVGAGDLAPAVRECWAEAALFPVTTHLLRQDVDPRSVRVALVVQEVVPAEFSGVLFTREPSGAAPDIAVLSWVRGLGEGLLAGSSSGSTLRWDRAAGRAVGGEPSGDALPATLLETLLGTALRLERRWGHALDVEWAWAKGRLVWLQARPITTVERPGPGGPITWTRALSEERYPDPISPLGWSTIQGVIPVNLRTLARRFGLVAKRPEDIARTIRHHVYSNERFFSIPGSLAPNPLAQLPYGPWYLAAALDVARHAPSALLAPRGPFGLRTLLLTRFFGAFLFPHAREIRRSWDRHLASLIAEMDAADAFDPAALSDRAIWKKKREIDALAARYMEPDLAVYVVRVAAAWMLERIGDGVRGRRDPELVQALAGGLEANPTLGMARELEALAEVLGRDEEVRARLGRGEIDPALERVRLVPEASAALDAFLARYGHLTTSWDLRVPTWGEDPRRVLAFAAGHLAAGRRRPSTEGLARNARRRREVEDEVRRALAGAPWMAPFFDHLLEIFHDFLRIDEEHHFYCSRLFRSLRRLHGELGRRLADRRVLDAPDDVFFLTVGEVERALHERRPYPRRYLARARRADFERSAAVRPPDRFLGQTPLVPPESEAAGDGVLVGVAASPGVAVGPARVVHSPEDLAHFREGDILVLASPKPELTPIYAVAGGLVATTGSLLSHGLVSAREYRLPAVIGIPDVTRRIRNGQRVRVDGDRGTLALDVD